MSSSIPLKRHWFHILLSLAGQELHGYGIMQDVLVRTDGNLRLWPARLYGALQQLAEAGLIEFSTTRPAPEQDDPRRRYYRLTPLGREALAAETQAMEDLVRKVRATRGMQPAESKT